MKVVRFVMNLIHISVRVKWGKQKFDAVELNTDEPPAVFKMQLFSLSGSLPVQSVHLRMFSERCSGRYFL